MPFVCLILILTFAASSQWEYLPIKQSIQAYIEYYRNLLGEDLGPLNTTELDQLEHLLETSLKQIRSTKVINSFYLLWSESSNFSLCSFERELWSWENAILFTVITLTIINENLVDLTQGSSKTWDRPDNEQAIRTYMYTPRVTWCSHQRSGMSA